MSERPWILEVNNGRLSDMLRIFFIIYKFCRVVLMYSTRIDSNQNTEFKEFAQRL